MWSRYRPLIIYLVGLGLALTLVWYGCKWVVHGILALAGGI